MNCCAVIIFLWLLSAEAACIPLRKETNTKDVIRTVRLIQKETKAALLNLNEGGQLPNTSCLSLNTTDTGLAVPEQQVFTAHHLYPFRCYMAEMSKKIPTLKDHLMAIREYIRSLELRSGPLADCNPPPLEPDYYVHVKCMLERLDQQLSKMLF